MSLEDDGVNHESEIEITIQVNECYIFPRRNEMAALYHYNPNSNDTVAYLLKDFSKLFRVKSEILDIFELCKPVNIEY